MRHRRILLNGKPWLMPEPERGSWVPWAVLVIVGILVAVAKVLWG